MKNGMKHWMLTICVLVLSLSIFTACSKKDSEPATKDEGDVVSQVVEDMDSEESKVEPVDEEPVDEGPVMDLEGMEIVIGDWWSSQEEAEPTNAMEEARSEYRDMIQKKYNFTMKQVAVSDWDGMQETITTTIIAEDPAAQIFLMAPSWIAAPLANGLIYDLSTLDSLDFSDSKWIKNVTSVTTFGDSIYGMNAGIAEPKLGVFFNKRLFQEAGLDPNLPYDLQANGKWTWEEFEKICKVLTKDTNNDGITDTYAMASFSVDLFRGALTSNDARFIGKDADGKYYNATTEPNFLESIQWAVGLIEKGYEMPTPEDANWDWFVQAFPDAKVAMRVAEEYNTSGMKEMEDDFGFVLFPKGPKSSDKYAVYFSDNIAVIPSCYDKETAEKIAFAFNLWTEPTPGYEDEDAWKDNYYTKFRDERAVDETLSMMYSDAVENNDYYGLISGLSAGDYIWDTYGLVNTPAEKIEEVSGLWKSLIEDANK